MSESNYPIPLDPEMADWVTTLDENAREYFEERAGIRQYDAGMSREEAESEARNDVLRWLSRQT